LADQNKVQWVYSSKNNAELAERYDIWAKDYDAEVVGDFDWKGPQAGCDAFARYAGVDAKVIDVGVGTGLAGVELAKRGFKNIDGFDLSQGMLDVAEGLGIYGDLKVGVLGETLDYADDTYDAALATGVFTNGHAPASGFDECARIVKPGGHFVITIRPDLLEPGGFLAKEAELEAAGTMKLVEETELIALLPKGEPDVRHQVRVYQVL
jgi:predicted TPR repeat methyltransferase